MTPQYINKKKSHKHNTINHITNITKKTKKHKGNGQNKNSHKHKLHNSSYKNITKNNKYNNKYNKIIKKKKQYTKTRNVNYKNIHQSITSHTKNLNVLNKNDLTLQTLKQSQNIQYGGLFGIDFIKLHWKMYKFNNIISKLNNFDTQIQKEIESYKIQAKTFEMRAQDKATINTEIINNLRSKIMMDLYQRDEQEMPKKQTSAIIIASSIATFNNSMLTLNKKSKQLDKEIGKDMPEYLRLMKSFENKIKKFNNITKSYATESQFYQEIQEIKRSYDIILENKKALSGLSASDKKKIKKFESNKSKYMKILNLSDSELQTRKLLEHEIAEVLKNAEYNIAQFGTYKGTKKDKSGELDKQMSVVNCAKKYGSGLLCEWYKKYIEFAEFLVELVSMCKDIIEKLKIIEHSADICFYNLNSVITDYKTNAHTTAITEFQKDIHQLIDMFDLITKSIELLKVEFYKQTPATHLLFDTTETMTDINFITIKLAVYLKIFNKIKELQENKENPEKQVGGAGAGASKKIPAKSQAPAPALAPAPAHANKPSWLQYFDEFKKKNITYNLLFNKLTIKDFKDIIKYNKKDNNFITGISDTQEFKNVCSNMYTIYMFLINYCYKRNIDNIQDFNKNMAILKNLTDKTKYKDTLVNIHKNISSTDNIQSFLFEDYCKTNNITEININSLINNNVAILNTDNTESLKTYLENNNTEFNYDDFLKNYKIKILSPSQDPTQPTSAPQPTLLPGQDTTIKQEDLSLLQTKLDTNRTAFITDVGDEGDILAHSIQLLQDIVYVSNDTSICSYPIPNTILLKKIFNFIKGIIDSSTINNDKKEILDKYYDILQNYTTTVLEQIKNKCNKLQDKDNENELDLNIVVNKIIEKINIDEQNNIDTIPKIGVIIEDIIKKETKETNAKKIKKEKEKEKEKEKVEKDKVTTKEDIKDNNNLLEDIIKIIHKTQQYPIQEQNITNEFIKIREMLDDLISGDNTNPNPIKTLSNIILNLTQTLLDIKIIEPKIVSINVKENKAIDIPFAGWIANKADADFDKLRSSPITQKLQERRLKNKEQIIQTSQPIIASKEKIAEVITLLKLLGSNRSLRNGIIKQINENNVLRNIFYTSDNIQVICNDLVKHFDLKIHPKDTPLQSTSANNTASQQSMCFILQNVKHLCGYNNTEKHIKIIDTVIADYGLGDICSQQQNLQQQNPQQQNLQQQNLQQRRQNQQYPPNTQNPQYLQNQNPQYIPQYPQYLQNQQYIQPPYQQNYY